MRSRRGRKAKRRQARPGTGQLWRPVCGEDRDCEDIGGEGESCHPGPVLRGGRVSAERAPGWRARAGA